MKYKAFKAAIKEAAEAFKKIDKNETIRVVSHLDADGISACSILVHMLNNANMKYSLSIIRQLDGFTLSELENEEYNVYLFSDLGSGQILQIQRKFKDKKIFILDHHTPEAKHKIEGIVHVNPHLFDIDGSTEVSGSGVSYLFAKEVDSANENMANVAMIGVIGDIQDKEELSFLNKEILDSASKKNLIKRRRTLKFFGMETRPLYKLLEYSSAPYIPGVSGSESGSIQFLTNLGINPKFSNGIWKKMSDLTDYEIKKLAAAIIAKRSKEDDPSDIFGHQYIMLNEKEGTPFRDAREFSTLLNSCGRLDKASYGIGACLGHELMKQKALKTMQEYKSEIVKSLNWFDDNKAEGDVFHGPGFVVINAKDNLIPTMVGTLGSMLSKTGKFPDNTFILTMGRFFDGTTKISLRLSGIKQSEDVNLMELLSKAVEKVSGESGGHKHAAGAIIKTEEEDKFIEEIKKSLEMQNLRKEVKEN